MKQIIFIFFMITGLTAQATAENLPVFHQKVHQSSRFSYNRNDVPSTNNLLVREIARINYLNLYKTGYELEYALEIKIMASVDDELIISSNLIPSAVTGDITYKGFDLTTAITPNIYGFSISVFDQDRLLLTFEPANLPVGETTTTVLMPAGDIDPERVNFLTTDIDLSYNEQKILAFNRRVGEINEFLAYLELLEHSVVKSQTIDPEKRNDPLGTHLAIFDLERFQYNLQQQCFKPLSNSPDNYLTAFQSSATELNSHLRRLRTIFTRNIGLQNIFVDEQTYAQAAAKVIEIQTGYLEIMKQASHFHEPVYMKFAKLLNTTEDWHDLLKNAHQTFNNIDSVAFRKSFGEHLRHAYMKSAEMFFAEEKYNEALLMLSNAEVICKAMPDIDCGMQVFHNMAKARYGIYDAYLSIAESAMENGNLNLAAHYLKLARNYQSENSGLIIIPAAVNRLSATLAWQYFESGRLALRDENIAQAMAHLTAAKEFYQLLNFHDFDDAIEKEFIKMKRLDPEAVPNNTNVQN